MNKDNFCIPISRTVIPCEPGWYVATLMPCGGTKWSISLDPLIAWCVSIFPPGAAQAEDDINIRTDPITCTGNPKGENPFGIKRRDGLFEILGDIFENEQELIEALKTENPEFVEKMEGALCEPTL